MTTLNELLKKIGLSEQEVQFIIALVNTGSASASQLAKITSIHRATIYTISKRLLSLGIIHEQKYKSGIQFQLSDPQTFLDMIKNEERELQRRMTTAKEIASQIQELQNSESHAAVPHYKLVEQADVLDFLYERALVWDESARKKDSIWWGFQNEAFIKQHQEWLNWFWEHASRKTRVNLFSDKKFNSGVSDKKFDRREVRVLSDSHFTATTWVMGDYIVQITSPDDYHLIEIQHETLADNHRAVFKALWERL